MSNSFSGMKKNRGVRSLSNSLEKLSTKKDFSDERIWKPERDKSGNFSGVIRFLPASKGSEDPFVKVYNHGFKKGNKWFIHNCPTTLGEDCPICEANSELWDSGDESNRKIVSQRKRKISYYANILVLKDPSNPQNEGKQFIYRFGVKIFEKILSTAEGDPTLDEEGIDIEDFWNGADFVLKMRTQESGFPTYEDSYFKQPSELADGDDDELKRIWENQYDLGEFIDPSKFKSYDELKAEFEKFLYGSASKTVDSNSFSGGGSNEDEAPAKKPNPRMASLTNDDDDGDDDVPSFKSNDEDDSPLAAFKKLAE